MAAPTAHALRAPRRAAATLLAALACASLAACTADKSASGPVATSAGRTATSAGTPTTPAAPTSSAPPASGSATTAPATTPASTTPAAPAGPTGSGADTGSPTVASPATDPAPEKAPETAPETATTDAAPAAGDPTGATRLVVLDPNGRADARHTIALLTTKGRGAKTGYTRAAFGQAWTDDVTGVLWGHNGCGTRDDVLARDLDGVHRRGRCVVTDGTFTDPYSGGAQTFDKARADQWPVDHVVPLAYAWVMGASTWSPERRTQFANDPLNLVITTRTQNTQKGDSAPASWLPPNKAIRCAYVARIAQVADKYRLAVTQADRDVMTRQCA